MAAVERSARASQTGRSTDPVAVTGVAVGLASLLLGFLQYRPNRLASGTPLHMWQAVSPIAFWLFLALLALVAVAELAPRPRRLAEHKALVRGLAGNAIAVLIFAAAGWNASGLIPSSQEYARISFAPGIWIASLSAYILIVSGYKRLRGKRYLRVVVAGTAVAAVAVYTVAGGLDHLSLLQEYAVRKDRFLQQLGAHLTLSLTSTALAAVIGIPLGAWAFRKKSAERPVFFVVNTLQTIPSLAMFGLLIAPLSFLAHRFAAVRALGINGIGWAPAIIALTLYALLPIARNTYASLKVLDPSIIEAGRGMGMGRRQLLFIIEFPLSLPIILGGVRTSFVQAIGNTTVAALIGAGGFGVFIFQGLGQAVPDLILLGTVPVIILAVAADKAMQGIIQIATPGGLRAGEPAEGAA